MNAQLDTLKFDDQGLIPTIIQDHQTGQVLVLCYMNREAIEKTLQSGKVHMFSRSRNRLALKGESSGNFQLVQTMLSDCDRDAVIFKVQQLVAACHEGYYSCFYRQFQPDAADWKIIADRVFDPKTVYNKG